MKGLTLNSMKKKDEAKALVKKGTAHAVSPSSCLPFRDEYKFHFFGTCLNTVCACVYRRFGTQPQESRVLARVWPAVSIGASVR